MGLSEAGATALSAGIGFLGNLGGSIAGGLFNANQARLNRKFQERMYNKQVEDNIKFWNMQNEYNLPSAQLERLRGENGEFLFNPQLVFGAGGNMQNVATGAPESAKAPSGAQASANFNTPIDMANLALLHQEIEESKSREYLNYKQSDESVSRTELNSFDLAFKQDTAEIEKALKVSQYDLNKSMESLNREQRSFVYEQSKKIGYEIDSIISDMNNRKALTAAQVQDINTRLEKFVEEFPHVIANLDSQTRLNFANALAAEVGAEYQRKLIDSGYIDILAGTAGQEFLNAIKTGTAIDIENGLKGLEFLSRPAAGSWQYKARNFMEYVGKPAMDILKDAALGVGGVYMMRGAGAAKGVLHNSSKKTYHMPDPYGKPKNYPYLSSNW